MAVNLTPGFDLQPSAQQVPVSTNYINNFDFLNQYLPDTYEKEFERYGNRTIASFLRMVGAEMPSNSDLIKWAEQGRLHIKYTGCTSGQAAAAVEGTWTIPNANFNPALGSQNTSALRVGQTVMISDKTPGSNLSNKGIVKKSDLYNLIYYSKCMCVPLKFGSGTRIKIIEAMAIGAIVVSTSKGIEGIDLKVQNPPFIIDNTKKIISTITSIIKKNKIIKEKSNDQKYYYINKYSMQKATRNFIKKILD